MKLDGDIVESRDRCRRGRRGERSTGHTDSGDGGEGRKEGGSRSRLCSHGGSQLGFWAMGSVMGKEVALKKFKNSGRAN